VPVGSVVLATGVAYTIAPLVPLFIGASYMSGSFNITQTINNGTSGAIVYATPVANTTLPTGTRNFDTSNSSYTPLLTIPYSGVPSYSGQNIILANTTTFAGTANNATYLNGQLAAYYKCHKHFNRNS
jgi:hypothetical protein